MGTGSRVHNSVVGLFEILRKFVSFIAKNELIEKEKSLQKDGHGKLEVQRPTK